MTSKQFTPYLLAGSLLLSGAFFVPQAEARMEALPTARVEDTRVTSIDDLSDVSSHHWAYDAVKELVEKYDVIEGYPQKNGKAVFKGQQFVTRYEMAAALRDLLSRGGTTIVSSGDMNSLNQLKNEFAPELAALDARTEALEARTTVLENNALKAVKIGGDLSVGALSNFTSGEKTGSNANNASVVSRLRLTVEAPIVEDKEGSKLGEGRVKARLVAAVGNNGAGFNGLSRIASDASANNETINSTGTAQTANTRLNAYFDRIVYEQDIKAGVPVLSNLYIAEMLGKDASDKNWQAGGTVFAGLAPWRDYFDKSAYRGKENDQFQNNAFVNIPGLASNLNSSQIGYAMFQNLGENAKLNVTTAFGATNPNDALNYYTASYEARLNYNWANLDNRKSALYAGGIHVFNDGNNSASVTTLNDRGGVNNFATTPSHTVYGGLDQEIYKGIGINLGYMHNNVRRGDVVLNGLNNNNGTFRRGISPRQALSAVLHVPTSTLGFRDGDTFGVGYAVVDFQDSLSSSQADRFEQVGEAYYNFKVNDRLSLIPSLQVGSKIAGTNTNDLSYGAGFRASVKF